MPLTLALQNETSLPDGGPLSVTVKGKRGLDIGRDSHLDWSLPDPSRYISGKHCEVRWRDGGYWLHDVSTNGTFINGADRRMSQPHRLRNGDRIVIGQYIVGVTLDGDEAQSAPSQIVKPAASYEEIWDAGGGAPAPPPIDPRDLRPKAARESRPDFLDWAVDVPPPAAPPPRARPRHAEPEQNDDDMAWAPPKPAPPPPAPPPAVPSPRRPVAYAATPEDAGERFSTPPSEGPIVPPDAFSQRRPQRGFVTDPPSPPMPRAAPLETFIERPPQNEPRNEPASAPRQVAAQSSYTPSPFTPPPFTPPPFTPPPFTQPPPPAAGNGAEFVATFARAAGLPDGSLSRLSADDLANLLGGLVQGVTDDVMKLLGARAEARRMTRAANQTMIQALANNPLKFAPSPSEAMRIMFGPPNRSYLDARQAFGEALDDLKTHQLLTFTAMQRAMQMLMEDLSPEEIEKSLAKERGLSAMVSSRKARAFEVYLARWQAKAMRHDNGMLGALLLMFSQAYEEAERKARPPSA